MIDDLHARRVGPMDWNTALPHLEARLDDLLARLSALENAGGTRIAEIEAINADLLEALQPFADKCEEILAAAKRLDCPPERFSTAVLWEDLEKAGAAIEKARET